MIIKLQTTLKSTNFEEKNPKLFCHKEELVIKHFDIRHFTKLFYLNKYIQEKDPQSHLFRLTALPVLTKRQSYLLSCQH